MAQKWDQVSPYQEVFVTAQPRIAGQLCRTSTQQSVLTAPSQDWTRIICPPLKRQQTWWGIVALLNLRRTKAFQNTYPDPPRTNLCVNYNSRWDVRHYSK